MQVRVSFRLLFVFVAAVLLVTGIFWFLDRLGESAVPPARAADPWWNTSWLRRRKISIDNSAQASSFTDFTVMVALNGSRVDYGQTQNSGQDIRFIDADGATVLAHEIEKWNETGTSTVWVEVPNIPASDSTDYIWMYYGNASASNGESVSSTWSNGYDLVMHFDETSGTHFDSSPRGNNSNFIDVSTQGTSTSNLDGEDRFVASSDDNVNIPDASSLDVNNGDNFTAEAWFRHNDPSGHSEMFIVNKKTGTADWQIHVSPQGNSPPNALQLWMTDGVDNVRANGATTVNSSTWHYAVGSWDDAANRGRVYLDGVQDAGHTPAGAVDSIANANNFEIGEEGDGTPSFYFDGRISEVRFSKVLRTGNWIAAQYKSVADTFLTYQSEETSWWNASWNCRRKVPINNSAQAETFTDFPVMAALNSSRVNYGQTKDLGEDIRFVDTDGTTVLAHEIEKWNESGTSTVWVKVPNIPASTSSDYIWMYYGNSGALDGQNTTSTWNANFKGVWHLKEDPTGPAPQMDDSTINANSGTASSGLTVADQVTGKVNGSLDFDGTVSDHVAIPSSASISSLTSSGTMSVWAYLQGTGGDGLGHGNILERHRAEDNTGYQLMVRNPAEASGMIFADLGDGSSGQRIYSDANIWSSSVWTYLTVTWDSSFVKFFKDGSQFGSSQAKTIGAVAGNVAPLTLGVDATYAEGPFGNSVDGTLDEIRLSSVARSAAWISADYKSTGDTFLSYDSEECTVGVSNLTQIHYRWRNDDGNEGSGFDTGTGADGSVSISVSRNINTDILGSARVGNPDGVVTAVTANPTGSSVTVASTAGFVAGDEILLVNLRGASGDTADVGNYEFLEVSSVPNGTTLNLTSAVTKSYDGTSFANQKVVVQRVPQWTSVTINSGGTLTANDWAGTSGGLIVFRATGAVNVNAGGSMNVNGKGYQGGTGVTGSNFDGRQGESYSGGGAQSPASNAGGGGGGDISSAGDTCGEGGAGGGYGTAGSIGATNNGYGSSCSPNTPVNTAGGTYGIGDLTDTFLGSGGGSGGNDLDASAGTTGAGGDGGGIVAVFADTITVGGAVETNGVNGGTYTSDCSDNGSGGGGAGGSIYFAANTATLGATLVKATGGAGGSSACGDGPWHGVGGAGGVGRIRVEADSISGTTNPSASTGGTPGGGGSSATWAAGEDTSITNLPQYTTRRLRLEVSNEGGGASTVSPYRLEYATAQGGPWTAVGAPTSSTHWVWANSTFLTDGASTTNVVGGLTDMNTTFRGGQVKDAGNQTAGIGLASTEFTELEYAIRATSTAVGSQIYYFRVTDAGAGLSTYSIYATGTVLVPSSLSQLHYRFRNDDGNESTATFANNEDTILTGVARYATKRLRLEVSNEGTGTSGAAQYRLEYATAVAGPWTQVGGSGSTTAHWVMWDSTQFADGASTTDVSSGLTNENATFRGGQIKDTGSQTAGITLASTEFTELEYSLRATSSAVTGQTYYFRLTDAGTTLPTYGIYGTAKIAAGATSGTLVSTVYDTSRVNGCAINNILWQGSQPAGTAVKFQLATANATSGPWNYRGPSCTTGAGDVYTATTGSSTAVIQACTNGYRYFRYKAILESDSGGTVTPRVDDVIINWSP